jgi:hypothetical protein
MPEGMNVEVAHKLSESEEAAGAEPQRKGWRELVEILEVAILAVVAVATAWSGYQATKWDGQQSLLYGHSSRDRFAADAASTRAGQQLIADVTLFNGWLQARSAGDAQLMSIYIRRFTPAYRVAFDAWLQTDPFTNLQAPPGPGYMPQYHNPQQGQADQLNQQATAEFNEGTGARETGDKYVRDTVLFASVLFLVAVAQRFKTHRVRVGTNVIALGLLVFTAVSVAGLPRL